MILITYGTRPELIKVQPIIDLLETNEIEFKTLFTGQHKDLVDSTPTHQHNQINYVDNRLNDIIINSLMIDDDIFNGVSHVLVQGDTTSVLGLAINAKHRGLKIIHLEAGLRTYDFKNPYPEEYNRVLTSKLADIHLAPTESNKLNLLSEGIKDENIFVVGNTVLDGILNYKSNTTYSKKILITLHRRENHQSIGEWFRIINELAIEYNDYQFILPIHPNPNVQKYKDILTNVNIIDPLDRGELLKLLNEVSLVITDSGGIQEESSFLNKKCLVCRKITERPESIGLSSFMVNDPQSLKKIFDEQIKNPMITIESPFGDGYSAKKIINVLMEKI